MAQSSNNPLRDSLLPSILLVGDTLVAFGGLSLAYWLRYHSMLATLGIDVPWASYGQYRPLLLVGVIFLVGAFAQRGLYDGRVVLRKQFALNLLARATVYWVVVYLAFSLVVKFDPPISRLFVVFGGVTTLLLLWLWRNVFYYVATRPRCLPHLQRRVALLGWNESAASLLQEIPPGGSHPYQLIGCVTDDDAPLPLRRLGPVHDLAAILKAEKIDVLLATRLDFGSDELARITATCEQAYAEWKVMPTAFPIFLSGLRLQTVGRIPVVGVEDLAINRLMNRMVKRIVDLAGATVGLIVSAPVIAVLAWLIKRESPQGDILFRQTRIGADHRPFTLYKLRSMHPDAAKSDSTHQSTRQGDTRVLRVGAFMRRWNLDELPQYWNVLRGQMSLVGPRPERPHHVEQLAERIPHYLPRHLVKPGMTGWAQVNGLRGATDLAERIRYDIFYIENWSLWFDLQIIGLTFLRWRSGAV
ncbi:sugar transferase [Actomonas aquatica]|uniref:Sugar transferase n=1 Tax=Actomonas aquatica TaxID=2866162 RepID=A0ABZ1CDM5_9BACT|nr:sugar transferase [Opitutus sp. WL0086]WRQ88395.1 sugar transferase [Opitutus sp. WL0086]